MQMIGDALAPAIAEGNDIDGDATAAGVDFRVALNQLLQEHLFLASFATGSALDGRDDEFAAAGAALNTNGTDLGGAIGGLFGQEAEDEWNRIWSAQELMIDPSALEVAGSTVTIDVTNDGPTPHNLTVRNESGEVVMATADLSVDGTETITAELEPGEYTTFCSLAGHESLGMSGTLTVTES